MDKNKMLYSCFFRSFFAAAVFNFRGLQNIGLLFVMEPALAYIYKDKEALLQARERYMWHFNTHPLWVPLLVGMFINLEQSVCRDKLPSQGMVAFKNTACYTLSAIGDSVFSGSLIPLWGLIMCCLLVQGLWGVALAVAVIAFLAIQIFRVVTFTAGLKYGLVVMEKLRKFDIMLWGDRIKVINGSVVAILIFLILPASVSSLEIFFTVIGLGAAGWLVFRSKFPRMAVVTVLFFTIWGADITSIF